jgi:TolA-binding protein
MNKSNKLTLTIAALAAVVTMSSCDSPAKKVEKANTNLNEAEANYNQSVIDSIADYENFKRDAETRIDENEKAIAAFRSRMLSENRKWKEEDQRMIDGLEQKNINLRAKIREYKENGKDEWKSFKAEFKHDMDELGDAIKGITIDNKK